jgi:hypothetical protein
MTAACRWRLHARESAEWLLTSLYHFTGPFIPIWGAITMPKLPVPGMEPTPIKSGWNNSFNQLVEYVNEQPFLS